MRDRRQVLDFLISLVLVTSLVFTSCGVKSGTRRGDPQGASPFSRSLRISEVMSWNTGSTYDLNGKSSDWIEIHNFGETAVNLSGYGLSDDPQILHRFRFDGLVLESGEVVVIRASGLTGLVDDLELHAPFRLSKKGESLYLSHRDGSLLDQLDIPALGADISFGRPTDQPGSPSVLTDPSPGTTHRQFARTHADAPAPPVFSAASGFHSAEFVLELRAEDNVAIHYSLDGSAPTRDHPLYDGPIPIADRSEEQNHLSMIRGISTNPRFPNGPMFKGTVVRAAAFVDGLPRSGVSTATYFIHPDGADRYSFPVVSLVADPKDFFDYDRGIYVLGRVYDQWRQQNPGAVLQGDNPANFNQRGRGWTVPFAMELFDGDDTVVGEGRVRTLGGWSRANPIKNLRLDFSEPLNQSVFPELGHTGFDSLVLRTSANDWDHSLFRDALMTSLVDDILEVQASRPAVLFLNGEYWGIHNIRERMTEGYFQRHFSIDENRVTVLEGSGDILVAEGTSEGLEDYEDVLSFIRRNRLTNDEAYRWVEQRLDLVNYIDYVASQVYFANTDWPGNNIRYWRDNGNGDDGAATPWRWLLYDTDFGLGLYDWTGRHNNDTFHMMMDPHGPEWPNPPHSTFLFRSLMTNPEFRHSFLLRFCDLVNTRFATEAMQSTLASFTAQYDPMIDEHIARWGIAGGSRAGWERELRIIDVFVQKRPEYILDQIASRAGLDGVSRLSLRIDRGGSVRINSLKEIRGNWTGSYFQGLPLLVEAVPDPGYRFLGWEEHASEASPSLRLVLEGDESLTARFAGQSPLDVGW